MHVLRVENRTAGELEIRSMVLGCDEFDVGKLRAGESRHWLFARSCCGDATYRMVIETPEGIAVTRAACYVSRSPTVKAIRLVGPETKAVCWSP